MSGSREIEFITTRKGGVSLLYSGRRYHRKKFYRNGNSFWLCYENNRGCSGNVTLNDRNEVVKENTQHSAGCLPNTAENKILLELDRLKDKASCNFISIQKQYDDVVHCLENEGIHMVVDIPKFSGVKTGLFNARNRVLGTSKMRFSSASEVVIPEKYENFLLADYDDDETGKRIILFCSPRIRHLIGDFGHILADGTFKSCPLISSNCIQSMELTNVITL